MAEYGKGGEAMARRTLSPEEEDAAIAEAERLRDLPSDQSRPVRMKRAASTVVLSVRLPLETARTLRALAAERNMSLPDLLTAVASNFAASPAPEFSAGGDASVFLVRQTGPGGQPLWEGTNSTITVAPRPPSAGEAFGDDGIIDDAR